MPEWPDLFPDVWSLLVRNIREEGESPMQPHEHFKIPVLNFREGKRLIIIITDKM